MMNKWDRIKNEILQILNLSIIYLDALTVESVQFYLEHDECEMAFEMLFIELMMIDKTVCLEYDRCLELGKELKLDEETVYDPDF